MNAPTALSHLTPEIALREVPDALIEALKARFGDQLLHGAGGAHAARARRVLLRRAAARRRGVRREHRRTWPMR